MGGRRHWADHMSDAATTDRLREFESRVADAFQYPHDEDYPSIVGSSKVLGIQGRPRNVVGVASYHLPEST